MLWAFSSLAVSQPACLSVCLSHTRPVQPDELLLLFETSTPLCGARPWANAACTALHALRGSFREAS